MEAENEIYTFMQEYGMTRPGDRVLVAFSGGGDSVFLTLVLLNLKSRLGIELGAIHINHQIRGEEAQRDEAFVRDFCQRKNIPCYVYSGNVPELAKEQKKSEEEMGRELRKEYFAQCAAEYGFDKIALAHTESDLAETLIHHLCRGTSLPGLGSLRPVRGTEIRPLLKISGDRIRKILESMGESWCEDSTNREDAYTRNGIRHHVIPYLEQEVNRGAVRHMAETSLDLMETENYLKEETEKLEKLYLKETASGFLISENILREPDLLVRRVLKSILERSAGKQKDLTRRHIISLLDLFQKQVPARLDLPYRVKAYREYEGIRIRKEEYPETVSASGEGEMRQSERGFFLEDTSYIAAIPEKGKLEIPGGYLLEVSVSAKREEKKYTKCVPYDKIKQNLTFRTRRPDDYMVINQEGNRKKLNRILIDRKIPQKDRDHLMLVCSQSEVLWIIGVRAGYYGACDEEQRFLRLEFTGGTIQ